MFYFELTAFQVILLIATNVLNSLCVCIWEYSLSLVHLVHGSWFTLHRHTHWHQFTLSTRLSCASFKYVQVAFKSCLMLPVQFFFLNLPAFLLYSSPPNAWLVVLLGNSENCMIKVLQMLDYWENYDHCSVRVHCSQLTDNVRCVEKKRFKKCRNKRFPPHLNNISTPPCETWNAHRTRWYHWVVKETPEIIPSQLWPPNSPDLNAFYCSVWGLLQEKVYNILITDLNELQQQLRMEWAKLGHVVIAEAICQWRCW